MHRAPVLFAALALLAAPALAGTAENPEITDAAGDAGEGNGWSDITSGWFNETATDIVATLQMAQIAAEPPGVAWYVVVDIGAESFGWGCSAQGGAMCFYGHWDRAEGPTDFQQGQGSIDAPSGIVTMNLPKAFAPNATAGSRLTAIEAGAGQVTPVGIAAGTVPLPAPLPLPGDAFFRNQDTATGTDFVLAGAAPGTPGGPATQNPNGTGPGGNGTGGNATAPPPPQSTPGPEPLLIAGTIAVLALAAGRRRRA